MLREPVDLEVRVQLAQLVGDRDVAPRVAEPDRRRDEQRALAARPAARPAACRRRRRDEVAQQQVHLAPGRARAARGPSPRGVTSVPPVSSASAAPDSCERIASSAPWITSTGQRTRAASSRDRRLVELPARAASRSASPASSRSAPADAVLDLLGRVRLGEDLREEELEEVGVVAQPVVAVVLRPALVGVELLVERARRPRPRRLRPRAASAGAMKTAPSTRSGWSAASSSPRCAPIEWPTTNGLARSRVASSTASASAANSASAYASAPPAGRTARCRARRR